MSDDQLKGQYGELSYPDPFDHQYQVIVGDSHVSYRIFWNEDQLRFVNHFEHQDAAEALEIKRDSSFVKYYTIGGLTWFGEEDVSQNFRFNFNTCEAGELVERLSEDEEGARKVSPILSEAIKEVREEVPPESYIELDSI